MRTFVWFVCLYFSANPLMAAELKVSVHSADEQAVANAVIYLLPKQPIAQLNTTEIAIMDQIDRQFSPHILVVQKGSQIRFPNSDSIKHHVYSFSSAKTFELQLYRGLDADPLLFDKEGVIELGCNIHDWMLGFVLVVDTPYFAKTNAAGAARLNVAKGEYVVKIWHPRIVHSNASLEQSVVISDDQIVSFKLDKPLRPDVNQYESVPADINDYD